MKAHSTPASSLLVDRPVDVLLVGGLVVDGTGAPGRVADVLVRDGRIEAIGHGLSAPRVHDVTGLVVAPGFVDIHTHSDLTLLSDPRARSKVLQGVTTEVVGNCGLGVAPLLPRRAQPEPGCGGGEHAPRGLRRAQPEPGCGGGEHAPRGLRRAQPEPGCGGGEHALDRPAAAGRHAIRQAVSYLDLDPGVEWDWYDLAGYLSALARARPAVNVATLVGHVVLHAAGCGFDNRPAGAGELDRMCGLLSGALDAGAVGLSTGLVYAPLPYATENELIALATVTARAGKVFTWHVRSYDDELLDSVRQAVRVALATGCRTQISHLCAVGRRNWGSVHRALDLIDEANAAGASLGVDIYPYLHGNAPLSQLLPAWAQEGGAGAWAPRLADPAVRSGIREAWKTRPTTWNEITISWTSSAGCDARVGRTIRQLADEAGTTGDALALDLLGELGNGVMMTAGGRSEDDLRAVLEHPAAVVASDGMSLDPDGVTGSGMPHPRSYGCFPRYLRRYAGNLPDAIRRCTSAPAARVGLTDRGVLRPGTPADVVVFDPDRIRDRATFTEPHQFAEGIELVLVNGSVAALRGRHTGARAGHVLRA